LKLYDSQVEDYTVYCKDPIVDGKIKKISGGFVGLLKYVFDIRKELDKSKQTVFHLRGFVAACLFFLAALSRLKAIKYIYDPRGMFIEEQSEIIGWFMLVSPVLSAIEKSLIKNSLFTSVTTNKFREVMTDKYELVDKFEVVYNFTSLEIKQKKINLTNPTIGYVGSVNYWHDPDELFGLVGHLLKALGGGVFKMYAHPDKHSFIRERAKTFGIYPVLDFVDYANIGTEISSFDLGISIVRPTPTTVIASPIKVSDYLASGILVVANRGIGDFDDDYDLRSSVLLYDYGNFDKISLSDLASVDYGNTEETVKLLSRDWNTKVFFARMNKELEI
jgi:hypothetical protein